MNTDIQNILYDALNVYGVKENICHKTDLTGKWKESISVETIETKIDSDLSLRSKLINQGRILEEKPDDHAIYWLIQLKGLFMPETLAVTDLDYPHIHIGAYAKEGLLTNGLAQKTVQQIINALK